MVDPGKSRGSRSSRERTEINSCCAVVPLSPRGRPVIHVHPVVVLWSSRGARSSRGPRLAVGQRSMVAKGSSRGFLVAVPCSMVVPWSPVIHWCAFVCGPMWPSCGRKNVVPRSSRGRTGEVVLLWPVVAQWRTVAHGRPVLRDPSTGRSLVSG